MDNLDAKDPLDKQDAENTLEAGHDTDTITTDKKSTGPLIIFVIAIVMVIIAFWQFSGGKIEKRAIDVSELTKQEEVIVEVVIPEEPLVEVIEEPALVEIEVIPEPIEIEPIEPEKVLPELNESDAWLQTKLPELTWRTELLNLVIDEDMIRRFVVFTDNFAQGNLAYEHSPFTLPKNKFDVDESKATFEGNQNVWQWNVATSKRFNLYIDLLRSIDSTSLVDWYFEVKPLVDEAYGELGYEDDFTSTLQDAITRVLDMELPKSSMALTRPSVMYKYQDKELEALPDSDKLLLRLGKENLLIIKSILLEINEKLAQKKNGVS